MQCHIIEVIVVVFGRDGGGPHYLMNWSRSGAHDILLLLLLLLMTVHTRIAEGWVCGSLSFLHALDECLQLLILLLQVVHAGGGRFLLAMSSIGVEAKYLICVIHCNDSGLIKIIGVESN